MAHQRKVANTPMKRLEALEAAHNALVESLYSIGKCAHHKVDSSNAISAANASDLATSKTLTAALGTALPLHGADTEAHTQADVIATAAAWSSAPNEPADLAEVQAALNEIKADWNGHIADAAAHRGVLAEIDGDGVLTPTAISTADATDQSSANALANALKSAFNIHFKSAAPDIVLINS